MHIAFIADQYRPGIDGVVISMENLAHGLRERGHRVTFIVPRYPQGSVHDINVIALPSLPVPVAPNVRIMIPTPLHMRKLKKQQFDIVHSHNQFAASRIAYSLSRQQHIPHVSTIHTLFPEVIRHYPNFSSFVRPLVKLNMRPIVGENKGRSYHLDEVVSLNSSLSVRDGWRYMAAFSDSVAALSVPSQHLVDKLTKVGVQAPLYQISNSIDTTQFNLARAPKKEEQFRFAVVGRLSLEKRQAVLLEAFSKLPPGSFEAWIIGDGPERVRYKSLALAHGLRESVKFWGKLAPLKVRKFLAQSHAGVLASSGFETQGISLIEYMASGLPVLYCDPDLRLVVSDECSILTKPNVTGLARGLSDCIKLTNAEWKNMSKAAMVTAQNYSIERSAEATEQMYNDALANFKSAQ